MNDSEVHVSGTSAPRRGWLRLGGVALALAGAVACRTPEPANPQGGAGGAGSAPASPSAAAPRPTLRHLITANPELVAKHVPADNPARVKSYLAAHSGVPASIAAAIDAHELWQGMTEAEVELSVGPASSREPLDEVPGGFALFYGEEGWLLKFDSNRFLASLTKL